MLPGRNPQDGSTFKVVAFAVDYIGEFALCGFKGGLRAETAPELNSIGYSEAPVFFQKTTGYKIAQEGD